MASWLDELPGRIGTAVSPYGFAPPQPGMVQGNPAAGAGMQFIGDMGMQMLANSRANPMEALGQAYGKARESARDRSKDAAVMKSMLEQAEQEKQKREEERQRKIQMEQAISQLPPEQQAMARMFPEKFFGEQIEQQFAPPDSAQSDPYYGTLVPLEDKDGNFVGYGQARKSGGIDPAKVGGDGGLRPMSPYDKSFESSSGNTAGKAPGVLSEEYIKKVRPEMRNIAETAGTIRQAREFLEKGIESGSGADTLQALRSLGSKMGFEVNEDVLANTQTYQNFIGNVVIPRMAALGGNDSNEELRKLYSLSGGDITQSLGALRNTLTFMESLMNQKFAVLQKDEQSALQLFPGLEPIQSPFGQAPGGSAGGGAQNDPLGIRSQ